MQPLTLIHSEQFPIGRYAEALSSASISPRLLDSLDHLGADGGSLRVVLIDPSILDGRSPRVFDTRTAIVGIGLAEQPAWLGDDSVYFHLPGDPPAQVLLNTLKRAYQFLYQKMRADTLERQLEARTRELREVSEVGIALANERDHSVLLTKILSKARELSRADAGSLYLLDEGAEGRGQGAEERIGRGGTAPRPLPPDKRKTAGREARRRWSFGDLFTPSSRGACWSGAGCSSRGSRPAYH